MALLPLYVMSLMMVHILMFIASLMLMTALQLIIKAMCQAHQLQQVITALM